MSQSESKKMLGRQTNVYIQDFYVDTTISSLLRLTQKTLCL